jgi:hypothetical protein
MSSLRAVLRDEAVYDYSLSEIGSKYLKWVKEDKYMILNRQSLKDFKIRDNEKDRLISVSLPFKSETFAVKRFKLGIMMFTGLEFIVDSKT